MPHPIFDAASYPGHLPEAKALLEALYQTIGDPNRIRRFYEDCKAGLPPLTLAAPADNLWREALNNLVHARALQKLCDALLASTYQSLHGIVRKVLEMKDVVDQLILEDDVLFWDREGLRRHVAQVCKDTNPMKVVVVRGPRRSGRTWSRYLFEQVARAQNDRAIYVCEGLVATVDDVIKALFDKLQAPDLLPPKDTSTDAWYRAVCSKLVIAAARNNTRWWIAVDDLGPGEGGAPLLDAEIRRFFEHFAFEMVDPELRRWFRLMLIGYPEGAVPTRWKREQWREDRPDTSAPTQDHLIAMLRARSGASGLGIHEDTARAVADKVLAIGAAASPDEKLFAIHDALDAELAAFGGAP